ncbi:hypothetical protein CGCSCA1_v005491 [Colletotrichum siamense]|nr:hypothetical protein CGCSCA1_v005491 [Colletotrichum siamense]
MRLAQVERSLANCMVLIRKQGNPSNQPLPGQSTFGIAATLDPPSLRRSPSTVTTEAGSSLQSSSNLEIMERMQEINAERSSPSLAASRDGVIAMIQTPSATHDNTFLPNPPSDDDIGLLRRADLACYFQLVHPNWSFLDENVLVEWFQACVEQKVPSNNYQSYFVQMIWNQSIWLTFDGGLIDANFEHLFAIRRTQSKIRRFWKQMRTLNGQSDYRIQNIHEIKAELDQWKAMIPLISSNTDRSTNCHPLSMLMLYNYCICCLFQNELAVPNIDDHAVLLTAASENARCFRRIQEHRPMVYCTWTTLLEQFTVGIILISCFWGTPYIYRSTAFQAPDTLQALEDCGSTLSRFANRWKDAEVYYETYTLLTSQTPISFPDNSDFEFPDQLKPQISGLTQTLEERGVSMAVLAMIGRIISSPASSREYT